MGHLYTTFGDKVRTCPSQDSPCVVTGYQRGFAISLETPNECPTPGMYCAAEMQLYYHFILEHGFISMQKTNKWKQSPCPKIKLHLSVPLLSYAYAYC